MTGSEPMRALAGAGANTRDAPQRLTDFDPTACEAGGLFDDKKRLGKMNGAAAGAAGQAQQQQPAAVGAK